MFSTATEGGAEVTLKALSLGASDYATKPTNSANVDDGVRQLREDLIVKLRRCARGSHGAAASSSHQQCGPASLPTAPTRAVAIVTSLGGPAALETVMPSIGVALRIPIFVVQHMVQRFTGDLATMLDHGSPTTVLAAGGHVVVQDQSSSVAWGTPAAVVGAGVANGSLKIEQVGGFIADATQTVPDGSHRDGPNNEPAVVSTATAGVARTASSQR